ncbi:alkaline-phosphatase-like protein [Lipomyces chichibuensis]|uniref:alkaline-phosphatase-like protein n=1 Tax=Lipomyces chichibuensis TaxID=1546026 RepID=UPI003343F154
MEQPRQSLESIDLEREEDITGDYDAKDYDKEILLQHDYAERLITDATGKRTAFKKNKSKTVGFGDLPEYKKLNNDDVADTNSEESVEVDAESHLKHLKTKQRRMAYLKSCLFFSLFSIVLAIFGAAIYVAIIKNKLGLLKSSASSSTASPLSKSLLSNGTHDFYPTTVYISLDGFRPDYLSSEFTPKMWTLYTAEYSAPFMYPSFPSVTFPNHYTMVTGLYPSSHGIVSNSFWDPDLQEEFDYHKPNSLDPKWWKGEPLWVTATKNGVKTAIHMWPGSEVPWGDEEPLVVDKFNQTETLNRKVQRVLGWLDQDIDSRPELIFCYVPTIDMLGHKYGTLGPEINDGLKQVDDMVGAILGGIDDRNISSVTNVVIVSDHGMASTSNDRLIFLDDLIDPKSVEHTDGWPLFGMRPYEYNTSEQIYAEITSSREAIQSQGDGENESLEHWQVYMKDDMPEEWHFGGPGGGQYQNRIAPVWIVPEVGWAITTRQQFEDSNHDFHPKGLHGFNNTASLMRALFLATGPSFPSGSKIEPFYNVELYDVICRSLNITGAPNNGTLNGRLNTLPDGWMDPNPYPVLPPTTDSESADVGKEDDRKSHDAEDDGDHDKQHPKDHGDHDDDHDGDHGKQTTKHHTDQDDDHKADDWMNYFEDSLDNLTDNINEFLDRVGSQDSDKDDI